MSSEWIKFVKEYWDRGIMLILATYLVYDSIMMWMDILGVDVSDW